MKSIEDRLLRRKLASTPRQRGARLLVWLLGGLLALPVLGTLPSRAEAADPELRPADEQRRRVRRHVRSSHRSYVRRHTVRHYHYPSYSWGYHYHPPVVYAPPLVVVQPEPIYVAAEPIYVEAEPVYVEEPAYAVEAEPDVEVYAEPELVEDPFGASFVVRFLGQNQSDADLSVETIEGAQLWGLGGALRFDLDANWMFELAADFLGADVDGASQLSIPVSLSALAHLFPDSVIDPYGVAGLGIIFTQFDDPNFTTVEQYTQFEAHLGFGAEINLGDWLVTADLRFLFMQARPERDALVPVATSQPEPEPEPTASSGNSVSVRGSGLGVATGAQTLEGQTSDPDDLQTGLQFLVGAGWRF